MLASSAIKKALRAAGHEVYRTDGAVVHVAERVRENLIMDANIRIDCRRAVVLFYTRTHQSDFPGEDDDALYGRARSLGQVAINHGYDEARTLVSDITDPGDPDRVLDRWFQVQYEKAVASVDEAVKEVQFVFGLTTTASR